MDLAALLEQACPIVNKAGWAFYFTPETVARGDAQGLDSFMFYVAGRGGVLGDVEPPVVAAAFGYFNPDVIALLWDAARLKVRPRDAAREFIAAAHDFGRTVFAGTDGLDGFAAAAKVVIDRARTDVSALSLFAAIAAEPEPAPDDLAALAMHRLMVLREFRGSAHLVAVVATGIEPRIAHFIRRPDLYEMFGWPKDAAPQITDAEMALLAAADEMTDRLVGPAYAALDDEGARALLHGLAGIESALARASVPGARQ